MSELGQGKEGFYIEGGGSSNGILLTFRDTHQISQYIQDNGSQVSRYPRKGSEYEERKLE